MKAAQSAKISINPVLFIPNTSPKYVYSIYFEVLYPAGRYLHRPVGAIMQASHRAVEICLHRDVYMRLGDLHCPPGVAIYAEDKPAVFACLLPFYPPVVCLAKLKRDVSPVIGLMQGKGRIAARGRGLPVPVIEHRAKDVESGLIAINGANKGGHDPPPVVVQTPCAVVQVLVLYVLPVGYHPEVYLVRISGKSPAS